MPQIAALYEEIDESLEEKRQKALALSNRAEAQRIEDKQILNDQAFFLLCWGQLEAELDEACRNAIRRRRADSNWEMRRGFDFYEPDDKRLSGLAFDRRVAIVLDKKAGGGGPYVKVMSHYEVRNKIAHGNLMALRINLSEIVKDFYIVQSAIRS